VLVAFGAFIIQKVHHHPNALAFVTGLFVTAATCTLMNDEETGFLFLSTHEKPTFFSPSSGAFFPFCIIRFAPLEFVTPTPRRDRSHAHNPRDLRERVFCRLI